MESLLCHRCNHLQSGSTLRFQDWTGGGYTKQRRRSMPGFDRPLTLQNRRLARQLQAGCGRSFSEGGCRLPPKPAIRPTSWRVTAVPSTLVIRKFKPGWLVRATTFSLSGPGAAPVLIKLPGRPTAEQVKKLYTEKARSERQRRN